MQDSDTPWGGEKVPRGFMQDSENRRIFLNWIARENGLDNLSEWYSIPKHFVLSQPGGAMIENYYNGSISKMLLDIYPEYD